METGEFGLFDVVTAKLLTLKFVSDIEETVDKFWRAFGLDESIGSGGKDCYRCMACGHYYFYDRIFLGSPSLA